MLPFVRMLEYGNLAPVPSVVFNRNLQTQYSNVMYLDSTGDLYGYGWNNYGQLGLGNNSVKRLFSLLHSDVVAYWTGVHGAFLITSTGRIKYTGSNSAFPQIGSTNIYTWTDVTSIFDNLSVSYTDIKEISISVSVRILLHDGRLLACGRNYYGECGDGTSTPISTLRVMPINGIDNMYCSFWGTHFVKGTDSYFIGRNKSGAGGTGDIVDAIISTPKKTFSNVGHISTLDDITWWFANGSTYWSGSNSNYQAGNGSQTNTPQLVPVLNPEVSIPKDTYNTTLQSPSSVTNSSIGSPIISYEAYVRVSGRNDYGQCGNGSYTAVPNLYPMPITVLGGWENVLYVSRDVALSAIITKDGKLYMCGGYGDTYLADRSINVISLKLMENMPWY